MNVRDRKKDNLDWTETPKMLDAAIRCLKKAEPAKRVEFGEEVKFIFFGTCDLDTLSKKKKKADNKDTNEVVDVSDDDVVEVGSSDPVRLSRTHKS